MTNETDLGFFERYGFLVKKNVVPSDLIYLLKAEVTRLETDLLLLDAEERARSLVFEKDLSDAGRGGISSIDVGESIFIMGDLCRYTEAGEELLSLPSLAQLSAVLLRTIPSNVVAHFMNATIKHKRFGRAINWHRDFPNEYISGCTSNFLRIMVCLDGMSADGGATRFIPASHHVSDDEAIMEKKAGYRHQKAPYDGCAAECESGDVVLIHSKVVHGSPVNHSNYPRRNIIIQVGVRELSILGMNEKATGMPLGAG